MFGKLLALPVRLLNVPARVADAALDYMEGGSGAIKDAENVVSAPLKAVADAIEEAVDGDGDWD